MPAVRTIASPPLSDSVTVRIPEEYRSYSLEIIVLPMVASMQYSSEYPYEFNREDANVRTVDGKPAFMAVRYRLTEDGAAELLAAQHDFEKIDEEMWK